jgi:hypothetical protein
MDELLKRNPKSEPASFPFEEYLRLLRAARTLGGPESTPDLPLLVELLAESVKSGAAVTWSSSADELRDAAKLQALLDHVFFSASAAGSSSALLDQLLGKLILERREADAKRVCAIFNYQSRDLLIVQHTQALLTTSSGSGLVGSPLLPLLLGVSPSLDPARTSPSHLLHLLQKISLHVAPLIKRMSLDYEVHSLFACANVGAHTSECCPVSRAPPPRANTFNAIAPFVSCAIRSVRCSSYRT